MNPCLLTATGSKAFVQTPCMWTFQAAQSQAFFSYVLSEAETWLCAQTTDPGPGVEHPLGIPVTGGKPQGASGVLGAWRLTEMGKELQTQDPFFSQRKRRSHTPQSQASH